MNIQINSEIDIFARSEPKAKVIGVTGTNGKSTTTALLGHMIRFHGHKVEVGGNIGKAATSLVDPGVKGYIVLELSSFQLETCSQLKLDGAGSTVGDTHKEYFSGENALKAGGDDNTMNQF